MASQRSSSIVPVLYSNNKEFQAYDVRMHRNAKIMQEGKQARMKIGSGSRRVETGKNTFQIESFYLLK